MRKNYVIYKYCVPVTATYHFTTYQDFRLLSAQRNAMDTESLQGSICLWAVVDTNSPPMEVYCQVLATGSVVDGERCPYYIATVQNVPFVWHLFANKNLDPTNSKHFS